MALRRRRQVTFEDRHVMLSMRDQGYGIQEICDAVDRGRRVVKRFFDGIPYSPYLSKLSNWDLAKELTERALRNRSNSGDKPYLKNKENRLYAEEKLHLGWSPELIAGRLLRDWGEKTNYQSIYDWIYDEREDLIKYLPNSDKKKNRKRAGKKRRKEKDVAATKRTYFERPDIVDTRERSGDWEGDSICSKKSTDSIFNLVERSTRYLYMQKIPDLTKESGSQAMINFFDNIPFKLRKTTTLDNGSENSGFVRVEEAVGIEIYHCDPGSPEQRGTVENRNGFIRRFFPKGTDFSKVTEKEIKKVQDIHNSRPMKCLGFRTPYEAFYEEYLNACDA